MDNPKIIDLHKSDDDGDHVKGRKGMNPGNFLAYIFELSCECSCHVFFFLFSLWKNNLNNLLIFLQGVDVVTEANVHVEDLNSLKKNSTTVTLAPSTTTTKSTTKKTVATTKTSISSTTTKKPKTTKPEKEVQTKESLKDSTSKTSLFVGIVLAGVLLSVLGFVGFKRLDAIRRR